MTLSLNRDAINKIHHNQETNAIDISISSNLVELPQILISKLCHRVIEYPLILLLNCLV